MCVCDRSIKKRSSCRGNASVFFNGVKLLHNILLYKINVNFALDKCTIAILEITIVIVSYQAKYFLEQTLRSAIEAVEGLDCEIIVVDNNSGDGTAAWVRERFGQQVRLIENKHNVGFGRANNQAIAQARGRYTLILNPDTIVTRSCLHSCCQWMASHPECGAIGVHMIDGDGHFLPESKRAFPTPWVSFCKIFGLSRLFPRSRWLAKYHLRYLDEREPHAVDILSGAFMFCRTSLLQQVGGFDEDFFMYGEDIDLSYRLVKAGYQNWYVPASIVHYKGESTRKESMRYVKVFYEAMLIFYRKHFPRYRAVFYPVIKLGVWMRQSLAMARRALGVPASGSKPQASPGQWVVLSRHAQEVARQCHIERYSTCIPASGETQVIVDDGSYSYGHIVQLIDNKARRGLHWHIYSSRNGIVISPKMQQP